MDVWEWTPLIALIVLAGLTSVPKPVLEAAAMDGAGYFKRLRYIVLPMIAGVMIVALLIRSMDAIRYFDIITNTTNGGPADATKIVPIRLYETAFRFFDLGYAAAIGLSMLGGLDHHGQRVPGHPQAEGAGAMKDAGRRIGLPVVLAVIMLWTLVPLHLDGDVLAQAERGPHGDAAEGQLLADPGSLPRPVQRRQQRRPRTSGNSIVAAGVVDDHRRRSWAPRRLRARALVLPRQGQRRVLDHLPRGWRRSRRSSCRCSSSSASPACSARRGG